MKDRIVSLPIKSINFSTDNAGDEQLKKVTLQVCKEGLVPSHGLIIEKEAIENGVNTILNKPLLCAYKVDEEGNKIDFQGHEMTYKIIKDGSSYNFKVVYIEQPVGVIPESCNYRFETIDDEEWFVVDAYLYKEYCEDAVRILEESDGEKAVSMEIKIISSNEDDSGITHIKELSFKGVTLLGEDRSPAITGANIKNFTQSDSFAVEFENLIQRVNKLERKGGIVLKRDEIISKFEHLKNNEKFESIISKDGLSDKELESQLFSLSCQDLELKIRESLKEVVCTHTDYWGDTYEIQKYWLCDILFEENIAIVEDNENWYKYYGIPFTLVGDKAVLDVESKERYIREGWRKFEEGNIEPEANPVFEVIDSHNKERVKSIKLEFETTKLDLEKVKAEFTTIQSDKANLETKVKDLEEANTRFEREKKEAEVNSVIEQFTELKNVDGFDKLLDQKFELPLEDLIIKLKVLAYDNGIILGKKNKNFSKDNSIKIPINTGVEEELSDAEKRYGKGISKYLDK